MVASKRAEVQGGLWAQGPRRTRRARGLLLIRKPSHMINEEAPRRGFSHRSPPINQLVNGPTKFNSYSSGTLMRWQTIASVEIASPGPRAGGEHGGDNLLSAGRGTGAIGLMRGAGEGGNVIMGRGHHGPSCLPERTS